MGSFAASIASLDQEHVRFVVFHDQDVAAECRSARSSDGEREAEGRSSSGFGFDPDPPMIPVHDSLTDGQSDAGP